MSSDKEHEKKSILGELESIKDLLNEQDMDNIPLLEDAIPTLSLDQAIDDIPVLSESDPTATTSIEDDPLSIELRAATEAINAAYNTYAPGFQPATSSVPSESDMPDMEEADYSLEFETDPANENTEQEDEDIAAAISAYKNFFAESGIEVSQSISDQLDQAPGRDSDEYHELSEGFAPETPANPGTFSEPMRQQEDDDFESQDAAELDAAEAELQMSAEYDQGIPEDSTDTFAVSTDSEQPRHVDDPLSTATVSETAEFEIPPPPGVLPGQQSLFSNLYHVEPEDTGENAPLGPMQQLAELAKHEYDFNPDHYPLQDQPQASLPQKADKIESEVERGTLDSLRPPLSTTRSQPPQGPQPTPASSPKTGATESSALTPGKTKLAKARGENPFLPKHIRERLHTNKALMDIIHEGQSQPAPVKPAPEKTTPPTAGAPSTKTEQPAISAKQVEQLVNGLVAEYLPKIEQELRRKLYTLLTKEKES